MRYVLKAIDYTRDGYASVVKVFVRRPVVGIVVPARADWCTIDMVHPDNRVSRVAVAAADREKEALAWEVSRRWPLTLDGPGMIARVLRTGLPEMQREAPGRCTGQRLVWGDRRRQIRHAQRGGAHQRSALDGVGVEPHVRQGATRRVRSERQCG